ncbi:putative membrane protein YeiH [Leeuwenhoekiella aestuarii]|uniref:Putative membrane protein YeiH n=1 Tax=Leeuwenhoekiella aestuarii TaxID=2249426 RepID=A0A4Q0P096_9FLAO|nr:trimeric intracellular cation channel family protein [Leeuwenhoekiella aestuarii]RXG16339.1 putative membrane protein YeiH [Leeuwenhoekiella aestuarii]RXG17032.1 putative membrane protein YeiH [Leeuwenhoekiella aestuarii]
MESIADIIDILGTIAFAISGVITATKKRMDLFGILIIATVTSVGGGTLRDLLIGKSPVTWLLNSTFVYIIVITTVVGIIFRKQLRYVRRSLFLFDTIGIALYTITGVEIALLVNLDPVICVALGTITACFGGVIRDILCNEIPVIFRKEIYASACIAGGSLYVILYSSGISSGINAVVSGFVVVLIRTLAVIYELQLPSIYSKAERYQN